MVKRRFHSLDRPIPTRQVLFLALDKQKAKNKSVYDLPLSALILEWPENMSVPQTEDDFKNYLQSIKFRFVKDFKADAKSHEASTTIEQKELMSYLMEGLAGGVFQQQSPGNSDDDYEGFITLAKLCNYVGDRIRQNKLRDIEFRLSDNYDPASKILKIDPERITNSIVKQVDSFYDILLGSLTAESLIMAAGKIRKLKSRKDVTVDEDLIKTLEDDFSSVLANRFASYVGTWLKGYKDSELRPKVRSSLSQARDTHERRALSQLNELLKKDTQILLDKDVSDLLKREDVSNSKADLIINDPVKDLKVISQRQSFNFFCHVWEALYDSHGIGDPVGRIITEYISYYEDNIGNGRDEILDKEALEVSQQ